MKLTDYRKIAPQINAEIEAVLKKHGFNVAKINASIEESAGGLSLSIKANDANLKDAGGNATTSEAERWKQYAEMYGLPISGLNAVIRIGGRSYTVAGLRKTNGSKPVVLTRDDGKTFLDTVDDVKMRISAAGNAKVGITAFQPIKANA